jgi:hypothetical protein
MIFHNSPLIFEAVNSHISRWEVGGGGVGEGGGTFSHTTLGFIYFIFSYIFYMLDWIGIFFQDRPDVVITLLLESITFFNTFLSVFH